VSENEKEIVKNNVMKTFYGIGMGLSFLGIIGGMGVSSFSLTKRPW
jgi:hypothetical protein